jgi:hypothetical protein
MKIVQLTESRFLQVDLPFLTLVSLAGGLSVRGPWERSFFAEWDPSEPRCNPKAAGNDLQPGPPKRGVQLQAEQMHRDGGKTKRRRAADGPQHRHAATRVVSFPQVCPDFSPHLATRLRGAWPDFFG